MATVDKNRCNYQQQCNDNEIDYNFCYKIAIEERARHQQNYNHWMNMYAIFNGALFIAYYSINNNNCCIKNNDDNLSFIINLLGCITSLLWCFSVHGYYDWIISWINVVSFYESKLKISNKPVYIYRLFSKTKKEFPFSTQKCTKVFTIFVFCGWMLMLIFSLNRLSIFLTIKLFIEENLKVIFLVVLFITIVTFIILFITYLREDLTKTHKNLSMSNNSNKKLDSDFYCICDFE